MTYDQLAVQAKTCDRTFEDLLKQCTKIIYYHANKFFFKGAEKEDVIQVGRIALWEAVRDYDISRGIPFLGYFQVLVKNKIMDAINAASRMKHNIMSDAASVDNEVLSKMLSDKTAPDPLDIIIDKECTIKGFMDDIELILSNMEANVIYWRLEDKTVQEIADIMQISYKAVDNALERSKAKLRKVLK